MRATEMSLIGNLTSDPELRFTPNGTAVANFTVANTPSRYNPKTEQYDDGEPIFMRCTAWRALAENVAECLSKGDRVFVQGNLNANSWTDKETGDKRTQLELQVQEVGASLSFASVSITKNVKKEEALSNARARTRK